MRILHIIQRYPPSIGGSEQWCQGVCRYSAKKGFDVRVLTLKVYLEEEFWHEPKIDNCRLRFGSIEYDHGIKIIRCKRTILNSFFRAFFKLLDKFGIYLYGPHSLEMYFRMVSEIKNTDVVHLHAFPHSHNIIGFFIAKLFRKKIVFTPLFHVGHTYYERKFNYWLMRKCDKIIVLSEYEKQNLIKRGLKSKDIKVSGAGISICDYMPKNLDEFKNNLFQRYNLTGHTKIVVSIARKIKYKGIDVLVKAVQQLRTKFNIKLFLIGPDFSWFREFYTKLSDDEKCDIIDLGIVSHQEKVNLLHLSDLFVLPSEFESFGIVFLESWICDVPVIGTKNGAIPETIGDNGLTSIYGDVKDLRDKIELLLLDKDMAREMAINGKNKVISNFAWDKIGDKVLDIYRSLTGKGFNAYRYDIEDFIGKGWYPVETDGFHKWVWSKGRALLNFPLEHKGISLEFSGGKDSNSDSLNMLICDSKGNSIGNYNLTTSRKQVEIPVKLASAKIKVAKQWSPRIFNIKDRRKLGVCLHSIRSSRIYREICEWPPSIFEIETTTLCNMNPPCVMCDQCILGKTPHIPEISKDFISKINPYLKYIRKISLHGRGEPLLSKTVFDILDVVDSKNVWTMFNSNGLLLTAEMSRKLILKGLKEINFSIDAATPQTYRKIRRTDGLIQVMKNIKFLSMLKKENKTIFPRILVNMILMEENKKELLDFITLAQEVGADGVYMRLLEKIDQNHIVKDNGFCFNYYNQMINTDSVEFRGLVSSAQRKAQEVGVKFITDHHEILEVLEKDSSDFPSVLGNEPFCKKPWENFLITVEGEVKICCHMVRYSLGNLRIHNFWELWNGEQAVNIRKKILNGKFPEECFNCPIYSKS